MKKRHIPFLLLALMLVVLAVATILEKVWGTARVHDWIYASVPFVVFWGVIAVTALVYVFKAKQYKRIPVFLFHVSLLIILLGAGLTWLTAVNGKMKLSTGVSVNSFIADVGDIMPLPFTVKLKEFHIDYYPGTNSPMDFVSNLEIDDGNNKCCQASVSMNNIISHKGYRFYQMGYNENGDAILSVTRDVWGIGVTYTGYAMLLATMLWILLKPDGTWRRMLRHPVLRKSVCLAIMMLAVIPLHAKAPRVLPKEVAGRMDNVLVLYNDRICPMQTLARDFTMKLCGKTSYGGYTAEQVLTGWLFYFDDWSKEPMIKVKSAAARQALGIDGRWASMDDFADSMRQYKLDSLLLRIMSGDKINDSRGIQDTHEKYELAMMAATGRLFKIFPLNYHGSTQWYSPSSLDLPTDIDEGKWAFIRKGVTYLQEQVDFQRWDDFDFFVEKLCSYQQKECVGQLPSSTRLRAEKLYNALAMPSALPMIMITLGVVLFIFISRKFVWKIGMVVMCIVLSYLTLLIALRWIAGNHVPLSNGYETMQFMSWVTMVFTSILIVRRFRQALPYGILISGLALMVASFGESNPDITHLMPVLHSPLLSVHVMAIMLAYSLLAFLCLGGIMAVFRRNDKENVERLYVLGILMLYPAVMLLTFGILIGAVWANMSWGTYWSWDPKETWALITLIIYSFPLHRQSLHNLSRPMVFHIYMICAFVSVIITYFGVNFFLGGMHSYA
ncbi:MAG: cytochrome c biogenesis protein CcsA [Muribaculaceae bacterium]|nr:cytochrome c biogenesis protein CcsA [Muribaculaceae bacterium]